MTLRLLLIAERADYRLLVRKHVEIEWPTTVIVEHRLGQDAPLDVHFSAAGFDAVVLIGAPPAAPLEQLATELLAKPEFAPIVFVLIQDPPPAPQVTAGLQRVYGRKIDRDALIRTLENASREHKQAQAMRRGQPEYGQR